MFMIAESFMGAILAILFLRGVDLLRAALHQPTVVPDDLLRVVQQAGRDVGLNPEALAKGTVDVAATGKLNDVIHHTALALGQLHPLRTVDEIVGLFSKGTGK